MAFLTAASDLDIEFDSDENRLQLASLDVI